MMFYVFMCVGYPEQPTQAELEADIDAELQAMQDEAAGAAASGIVVGQEAELGEITEIVSDDTESSLAAESPRDVSLFGQLWGMWDGFVRSLSGDATPRRLSSP